MNAMPEARHPGADDVRSHLQSILASQSFAKSKRLSNFLRYITEAQLEGRGDRIKERTIGIEVFERGAEFDPSSDNIVRIEAGRLRHKLREYYDTYGRADAIRIDVPKGTYTPVFRYAEEPALESPAQRTSIPWTRYLAFGLLAAAIPALAVLVPRLIPQHARQPSPEVAALYRKGRDLWSQRTVGSLKESVNVYRDAIRREPGYADAWAGLADSYAVLVGNDYPDSGSYVNDGVAAARRAMELNPKAGRPHAALAAFHRYTMDFQSAERENRLAVQLSPNDAVVHQWYGHLLMFEHRYQEALAQLKEAQRLDPSDAMIGVNLGEVYFWMGDYDKALACFNRVLNAHPRSIAAAIGVESVAMAHHRYAAALDDVNRRLAMFPDDPGLNANRRVCLQALGRAVNTAGRAN